MESVCIDVVATIMRYSDPKSIVNIFSLCRYYNKLLSSDVYNNLWKDLVHKYYRDYYIPTSNNYTQTFITLYNGYSFPPPITMTKNISLTKTEYNVSLSIGSICMLEYDRMEPMLNMVLCKDYKGDGYLEVICPSFHKDRIGYKLGMDLGMLGSQRNEYEDMYNRHKLLKDKPKNGAYKIFIIDIRKLGFHVKFSNTIHDEYYMDFLLDIPHLLSCDT
ncbi:F-box domain-containing protein [Orpheovirus IHUMI-LCC2]|uniref:F-box domain-containing protein n=1 Tax=Orpheovirus IHUMI-LCC2 TaxID=2023057 RepID=A0A2I2L4F6_9VIRU|nr:F-box domain-containing protein [Orpheovirus IHUMI-LCC2]SNW62416.1 F-box domain-containing protein [Orpheovirus IHUMI-LCC2]